MYVQLTFMETMDKYGMDAPAKKYQELLAKANYKLLMCRLVKTSMIVYFHRNQDIPTTIFMRMILTFRLRLII